MFFKVFFIVYGVLSLTHLIIQIVRSEQSYRQAKLKPGDTQETALFSASVVLPIFNEKKEIVDKVIRSILNQKEIDLELFIIDDYSDNREELTKEVYSVYDHDPRVTIFYADRNQGKRHSQKLGFDAAQKEYIVTIDSDTILHEPLAIQRLLRHFKTNGRIGAVTGNVGVENKTATFLTRLISYRYWFSFNQEREAQSLSGVVFCCSGPFSAYKKSIIDKIKERYVSQVFFGKNCTYGDDRHLTNLVLEREYQTIYARDAKASTYVPETMKGYLKQQVRWNKSFYRELLWSGKLMFGKPIYFMYELMMQTILPFLLLGAILTLGYQIFFQDDYQLLFFYFLILLGMSLIRIVYAIYRTKDRNFFLFLFYAFLHVVLLLPTRLYALVTLNNTKWGTR